MNLDVAMLLNDEHYAGQQIVRSIPRRITPGRFPMLSCDHGAITDDGVEFHVPNVRYRGVCGQWRSQSVRHLALHASGESISSTRSEEAA